MRKVVAYACIVFIGDFLVDMSILMAVIRSHSAYMLLFRAETLIANCEYLIVLVGIR